MQGFEGIWIPLVTPFAGDRAERVDHDALRRLVGRLAVPGIAGFVACGSTGEAGALDEGEQLAVLRTTVDAAGGLPVVMGVSAVTPREAIAAMRRCEGVPLAGVLVTAPPYVRPSQRGVHDFFVAVADAAPAPLVLYDIPARTGVRIETQTLLALAAHPAIAAVKDCSGDADHLEAILADGRLQVLAGDDHRLFSTLCAGGSGAIAASAHLWPERFVELHRLTAAGALLEARALWRRLWPLTKALFAEPNPAPLKGALAASVGLPGALRAPMTPAARETVECVRALLSAPGAAAGGREAS
jgi:4-hydroxy-tetrahydrodipicolinate synthase